MSSLVKRRQAFATRLRNNSKLVVGYSLEQRLRKQAKALNLFLWLAGRLGCMVLPHGIDCLPDEGFAGLDHPNESTLIHLHAPIS